MEDGPQSTIGALQKYVQMRINEQLCRHQPLHLDLLKLLLTQKKPIEYRVYVNVLE